jgi:glucans biosynthesis protein C
VRAGRTVPVTSLRRNDLDRLRVLAVLLLFPFHSARVFNVDSPWYVKNPLKSQFLSWAVVDFLDPWHMPLLFVLAGAATWFALGHRSSSAYAKERKKRLLVPLIFGLIVIVPPQAYLAQLRLPNPVHSYVTFYGNYWQLRGDLSGYGGWITPGHLWFIWYLFMFSLAALPLFAWLHRIAGGPEGRDIGRGWMLFAMPVFLLLAEALPAPAGVWSPFTMFVLFVGGFVLVSSPTLEDLVRRWWPRMLAGAVFTMAAVYAVNLLDPNWTDGSPPDAAFQLLECTNTWLWVLWTIGAAGRYLSGPATARLGRANEGAYPAYILHQTVIVAVAYVVVRWDLGVWPKYLTILATGFAVTLLIYDLAVRRWNPVRFLFGLKPRGAGAPGPPASAPTLASTAGRAGA